MPFAENVFVSTTSSVDHADIVEYHGVIATHVVAGTGLFSDVAASFSDVFGGRSKSYQKQLAKINAEAVRQLKSKAASEGANGILGLRIDHDQVSSQGKAMFMVTAMGTAVALELNELEGRQKSSKDGSVEIVPGEELDAELRKQEIIAKLKEGNFAFSDDEMKFLRDQRVEEAAPLLIQKLGQLLERYRGAQNTQKPQDKVKEYFMSLPRDAAADYLYAAMLDGNWYMADFALDLVKERDLFEANSVKLLIEEGNLRQRKAALQLVKVDKLHYSRKDLAGLEALHKVIRDGFPDVVEIVEEKHTFSSKTTTKWKCACGKSNEMNASRCSRCKKSRRGFKPGEWSPEQAAELIKRKMNVLRERLGVRTDSVSSSTSQDDLAS
jgi:uncharacterized protein YbjQ (UPF0145 family)